MSHPPSFAVDRPGPLDFDVKDLLSLNDACKHWPARGHQRPLNLKVAYRYVKHGKHNIRLRAIEVPGVGLCTTILWIEQFIRDLNPIAQQNTKVSQASNRARRKLLRDSFSEGQT